MTTILNEVVLNELEATKKVFKALNFSNFETEQHLDKINTILTAKIITTLLENKSFQPNQATSSEAMASFINEKYNQEEIGAVVKKESTVFLRNYFESILRGVDEAKLNEVKAILN